MEGAFPPPIVILPLTSDDHMYLLLSLSLFLLWTILKIFIESVPTLLLSYVFTFWT